MTGHRHTRKTVQGPRNSGRLVTCSCGWATRDKGKPADLHGAHVVEVTAA